MSAKEWRAWTTREVDVMRANGHLGVKAVHETVTRGTFDDFCGKLRRGVPDR